MALLLFLSDSEGNFLIGAFFLWYLLTHNLVYAVRLLSTYFIWYFNTDFSWDLRSHVITNFLRNRMAYLMIDSCTLLLFDYFNDLLLFVIALPPRNILANDITYILARFSRNIITDLFLDIDTRLGRNIDTFLLGNILALLSGNVFALHCRNAFAFRLLQLDANFYLASFIIIFEPTFYHLISAHFFANMCTFSLYTISTDSFFHVGALVSRDLLTLILGLDRTLLFVRGGTNFFHCCSAFFIDNILAYLLSYQISNGSRNILTLHF